MTEPELLLHAMLLVGGADGALTTGEKALMEGHFCTLPELRTHDFRDVFQRAEKLLQATDPVAVLRALSPAAREKAWFLAVDIAMCSGDMHPRTRNMLDAVKTVLGLDAALATKIREVIALKYVQRVS